MTIRRAIWTREPSHAEDKAPAPGYPGRRFSRELEESIRRFLLRGAVESGGTDRDCRMQPLHAASVEHDSLVYAVSLKGTGERFILKRHNSREDPVRASLCAGREYTVLEDLGRVMARHPRSFRVPEAVAFFPEYSAILMTECPGKSFARQLRWARLRCVFTERKLLQGAASCGKWLGWFHTASRRPKGKGEEIRRQIEYMFKKDLHSCARLGLEESIISRASEYFTKRWPAVFEAAPEYTGHHGDFGPCNVFLSPECATAIDFEGFRMGIPGEDVADFLVLLKLLPFYHAAQSLRLKLCKSFLNGYLEQHSSGMESLDFFELQALVKRMAHNPLLNRSRAGTIRQKRRRLMDTYRKYFESLLP